MLQTAFEKKRFNSGKSRLTIGENWHAKGRKFAFSSEYFRHWYALLALFGIQVDNLALCR